MISSPLPVGTIMNIYHAVAPSSFASLYILGISSWFLFVKDELMMNSMPCFLNKLCSVYRAGKRAFLVPEIIMDRRVRAVKAERDYPDAGLFYVFADLVVTRVPFVARHILKPLSVPYLAISKTSFLKSGSPPERTTTGCA